MNLSCTNCNFNFAASEKQKKLIDSLVKKRANLAMISCPNCNLSFGIDPSNIKLELSNEIPWRTPISGCHGFVSKIIEGNNEFYGCGETGAIWSNKIKFYKDISEIIEKYPHRKLCYIKNGKDWIPNSNEPENMDKMINLEESENLGNYNQD